MQAIGLKTQNNFRALVTDRFLKVSHSLSLSLSLSLSFSLSLCI